MARDGLLPRGLARTGFRGTLVQTTSLVAAVVGVTAAVLLIVKLEEMVNVGTLFAFVLMSSGVVILRRTRPDLQWGFRVPLLPIALICASVWLMLNLTALIWIRCAVWLLAGIAIYVGYRYQHSVQGRRKVHQTHHVNQIKRDPDLDTGNALVHGFPHRLREYKSTRYV